MMRLSLAWSLSMALVQSLLGRWIDAVVMVLVGGFTWRLVSWVLRMNDMARWNPGGPRLLRRRDGRVCIAKNLDRAWHEPARTRCEEDVATPAEAAAGALVTCMACIAED